MSKSNDIYCGSRDNEKECLANAKLVSLYAKRFGKGQWSFIGPGSEKKWYCISEDSPQGVWDNMAERMLLKFAERGCPIFRATRSIVQRSIQKQRTWKTVDTLLCRFGNDWDYFSHYCFWKPAQSLRRAVTEMCEEYETFHDRTGQLVVIGQSIVLSAIKSEVPLDRDDPANQDLLLQQYGEWLEMLSQQDKLSNFCMDAGFLNVVDIGQYFRTKDTAYFSQFYAVACREYTLPRDEEASQPKGWIQGHTKIGPVMEVTTCCLQGKYGVEIRILSVNRDNSHSWVRISHGSNKCVKNLNNNEEEIPEIQLEEYAWKLDAKDFACRSKATAKPRRREPAGSSPRTIHIGKRTWTDVEPGECRRNWFIFFVMEINKEKMMERFNSGE